MDEINEKTTISLKVFGLIASICVCVGTGWTANQYFGHVSRTAEAANTRSIDNEETLKDVQKILTDILYEQKNMNKTLTEIKEST